VLLICRRWHTVDTAAFYCDNGLNFELGERVFFNFKCVMSMCAR